MGVEFFFLVSGYLMAMKIYNKKEEIGDLGKETLSFIINKINSIFPYHFFSFLFCFFKLLFQDIMILWKALNILLHQFQICFF